MSRTLFALSSNKVELGGIYTPQHNYSGAQLVNFERGRRYIYNRKDEIIHGLSPSVKYVAPLFRDMSLAKV